MDTANTEVILDALKNTNPQAYRALVAACKSGDFTGSEANAKTLALVDLVRGYEVDRNKRITLHIEDDTRRIVLRYDSKK